MTIRRAATFAGSMLLFALSSGCSDSPTKASDPYWQLLLRCEVTGVDVTCSAELYDLHHTEGSRDVTGSATWSATGSAAGHFEVPGRFSPTTAGEVAISASYRETPPSSPARFLVDPAAEARWIQHLAGFVKEAGTGRPVSGATVRILTGYANGNTAISGANGYYYVSGVLAAEEFEVSASMTGYETSTISYHVDPPVGSAGSNPPYLEFALRSLP